MTNTFLYVTSMFIMVSVKFGAGTNSIDQLATGFCIGTLFTVVTYEAGRGRAKHFLLHFVQYRMN